MKRYEMRRTLAGRADVTVVDRDGTPRALPHLAFHSPDGFEWGYGGSGPSDLARSIVGDFLGVKEPRPSEYQAVKWAFVAKLPFEGGIITEHQIREVVQTERASNV